MNFGYLLCSLSLITFACGGDDSRLASPDANRSSDAGMPTPFDAMVPSVIVSPANFVLKTGERTQFTADMDVVWTMEEMGSGYVQEGSYLAPLVPGSYTLRATSTSDSNITGVASITVEARTLSLLAGALGGNGSADDVGLAARFGQLRDVVFLNSVPYLADQGDMTIRAIDLSSGMVSTYAGQKLQQGDTNGTMANMRQAHGITSDGVDLYFTDTYNHSIKKIEMATGAVSFIAGGGINVTGTADGTGAAARFNAPQGITTDGNGNLYVTDTLNHSVRKIEIATGVTTTLAGAPGVLGSDDGLGMLASFRSPMGIVFSGGMLYVADTFNNSIRQINPTDGFVTTIAGGAFAGSTDGVGFVATFSRPNGITSDGAGTLYICDTNSNKIRKLVINTQAVTTIAGGINQGFPIDGGPGIHSLRMPTGITFDSDKLYFADYYGGLLRVLDLSTQSVQTLAGRVSHFTHVDGVGTEARLRYAPSAVFDGNDTVYFSDGGAIRTLLVSTGEVSTLAGTGVFGESGAVDGVGDAARFRYAAAIAWDGQDTLYIVDTYAHLLRKLDLLTNTVSTIAGLADTDGSADGIGAAARFSEPMGVAWHDGKVYVADRVSHVIRQFDTATGMVTTIAGIADTSGADNGVGSLARFNWPTGLTILDDNTLLIWEEGNRKIRQLDLTTFGVGDFAGQGAGYADGVGMDAKFINGESMSVSGEYLLVADKFNGAIRAVHIETREVTTILGDREAGVRNTQVGVSLGTQPARLNSPGVVVGLGEGRMLVVDETSWLLVE